MDLFKGKKGKCRRAWKKMAVLGLVASVAIGGMAGCKGNREGGGALPPAALPGQEGPVAAGEGQAVARGRYVENEVALPPGTENDRFISLFWGEGHQLELYTAKVDDAGNAAGRRFLWDGGSWQEDAGWWDRVRPQDTPLNIRRVFYGLDGNYYFSGMTVEGYCYHLYRIGGDGQAEDLLPQLFFPEEGRDYGWIPTKAEVGKDGGILLHGFEDAVYYQPDGKKMFSMEKSWGASSESSIGYLTEKEFVAKVDGGITRYSLTDGQAIEMIPYDWGSNEATNGSIVIFGDRDGGIYAANERGLAHVGQGGGLWELLIDGAMNTMGMRSMYLEEFLAGEDNDFYGIYVSEGGRGMLMCHYTYDPDAIAVLPKALTVYGLTDNSTIRQAAALFQKSHPDVRVEVLTGANPEGGVSEETIRALNTELLNGKGADVLVLDGLPAESYEKKGVLMDLKEVFADIQKESPIMGQVVKNFTKEDGSIYQMPARIQLPVAVGDPRAATAFASLDGMAGYQGEKPLLRPNLYENLLRLTANLQYEELFGNGDGVPTQGLLEKYLETVKALGEDNGSRTMFTQEEMERLWVSNHVMPDGITGSSTEYDRGSCACGVENLKGMFDAIIPVAVLEKHPEATMSTINGVYLPQVRTGVNQGTAQPQLAKEFIRCLFSPEVQKEEFFDGFPVSLAAQQENCRQSGKEEYSMGSGYGDYHISGQWPDPEKREEIYKMLEEAMVPAMVDETVMGMIVAGSRDYFDGKATVRQAAEAILRQVAIYQAEQG